ncbi:hypothetical protein Kpol_1045p72 [Vanderwaltozyma polyspora DSM 70294]|uniref:Nitrogen permease regulator 2 n=1 Tax=Vanderwaltozyma polyspora (strain ATCC 22028 / DSM 70294 / BCRC 21397 / CBS 2163 / NBRC 10782 / NRRL Y-8283 / UCD 57-17) TaxID=436907 RepID=A7TI78_VANPO|nr:uncharacterized protein Kpol_1045p72 [Vanderwaltozyma polyspora DSM 70294]EDO18085.1 hypothetical protein Kpol_1045p72 [Vanderwaltozyma polyspora DSM 70294]
MVGFDGFEPIHTIFYSVFHPTEGPKVCYQFPPNNLDNYSINFDSIRSYVIPKPQLCNKLLTLKYGNYRIIGYPITINCSIYARNNFSFNLVFVFPYECKTSPYESVIVKLGKMFRVLEEQSQFLSKAEKDLAYFDFKAILHSSLDQDSKLKPEKDSSGNNNGNSNNSNNDQSNSANATDSKKNSSYLFEKYKEIQEFVSNDESDFSIQDFIMRLYQDLNNYSECLIPIDAGNAVDIKLFPLLRPPPATISIEDVPISRVNLKEIIDVNWDPTMLKIVPHIDGVNSIAKIAKLSDSDTVLVIECIKHFIYYGCVVISDIFQFSNIYAPTSLLRNFLTDPLMATECQTYVTVPESSTLHQLPLESLSKLKLDSDGSDSQNLRKSKNGIDSRAASFVSSRGASSHNENSSLYSRSDLYLNRHRSESSISSQNTNDLNGNVKQLPTRSTLFDLYRSLSQGVTLKEWYKENFFEIRNNGIDIRKFIIFGIINGLLYRCQSFPVTANFEEINKVKKFKDIQNRKETRKDKLQKQLSQDIFSTSDIKVGEDLISGRNRRIQTLDLDIADSVLKNVYKKLTLKTEEENSSNRALNSQELEKKSVQSLFESSNPYSKVPKRPGTLSKVSFQQNSNMQYSASSGDVTENEDINNLEKLRKQNEQILLEALESTENLDKICVLLEKPRSEVEEMLKHLVDFKVINS